MKDATTERPLIGASEAARLVGLSRSRLYRLINEGAIPDAVVRVPGCELLIRRAALLRWAEGPARV